MSAESPLHQNPNATHSTARARLLSRFGTALLVAVFAAMDILLLAFRHAPGGCDGMASLVVIFGYIPIAVTASALIAVALSAQFNNQPTQSRKNRLAIASVQLILIVLIGLWILVTHP